ncbi:hypothetical protein NQ315_012093 [Exocentrus adspersus]|uniref:Uncharacterized protein n=1 Tax=Exocentrus adspersus TaxID=1586481 RepID=A0AAV8VXR7_9CUCU|nr:hypothetical protein NQ315_012093 [Exocentrus adspersus]
MASLCSTDFKSSILNAYNLDRTLSHEYRDMRFDGFILNTNRDINQQCSINIMEALCMSTSCFTGCALCLCMSTSFFPRQRRENRRALEKYHLAGGMKPGQEETLRRAYTYRIFRSG